MVLAREQRLALDHLGEDAPGAPDVDLDVVLLPRQHDLRRAVVSSRNVARHLGILQAGEAEVADLEIAVLVDEDVAGLEVAVDDAGRVDVFQSALHGCVSWLSYGAHVACRMGKCGGGEDGDLAYHDLIQEVLDELRLEGARSEEAVEIRAEELSDEIAGDRASASRCKKRGTFRKGRGERRRMPPNDSHVHVLQGRDEDVA